MFGIICKPSETVRKPAATYSRVHIMLLVTRKSRSLRSEAP
jgi:hypothetical protein